MATQDEDSPAHQDVFVGELRRWREVRGMSRTAVAVAMGYSRSYVSKVESGHERPSREFAKAADDALNAGGALRRAWREHEAHRPVVVRPTYAERVPEPSAGSLFVEHDDAELRYDGRVYRAIMRRRLVNNGSEPITRYMIRISVDRFPGDPDLSNQLYRDRPLTWEELDLQAWYGEDRSETMRWVAQHDRDAFKEVWLQFANDSGHFPLYPGQSAWIEYTYSVQDDKWGNWFQRAVRLPTSLLSVRLDFPDHLDPAVWGLHTSMTAESMPFRTAIDEQRAGNRRIFSWTTEEPPMHARYRLEWHFRQRPPTRVEPTEKPSQVMRSLGVVQSDDPILHRAAKPFQLPEEAEDAKRVIAELVSAAKRVAHAHTFGKGMGLAANQIGIDRAASIVFPPGSDDVIMLLNPRIIENGAHHDEQYEGCLSFFDVRGLVPRPLVLHVEHQDLSGHRKITIFERGVARLVAHEIDHLHGTLYTDRLPPGAEAIPIEQYGGSGLNWQY
ncbi:peptide deformylase [Kibdelosporangium banguiense]|uniref:Peptide deformylase n=1 Tax=Kibdelosporangium banguiense TaxID=1365924 RepID=A0ABS4TMC4_9PSEU|nr:peptide deformylase [Kibdelosporangium banguiense]MBP2325557.1 peptide deformylase [Kibdelosporangium banguiense]